jgi:hypothetical protein
MVERYVIATGLLGAALLLVAPVRAQPRQTLIPGDALPSLSAQTLTGKQLNLPSHSDDGLALVIFSFSRAGGRDAQKWAQAFSKQEPQARIYTVIVLESVPKLFQPMAVSAIRRGMPISMQDQTMILYRDENLWKQRLQVTDVSRACVILFDLGGHIKWLTTGPFTEPRFQSLREQTHASK